MGSHEVQEVLGHYRLARVKEARAFNRGSSKSPKVLLRTLDGDFILKRCAPGQDDPDRLASRHRIVSMMEEHGCPIAGVVPSTDGETFIRRGSRLYELFRYVEGRRYRRNGPQAHASGYEMARMHDLLQDWDGPLPEGSGYHEASGVETALQRLPERLCPDDPHRRRGMTAICRSLAALFGEAHSNVDRLGYGAAVRTIVHGDWHPGNVLFDGDEIVAILDFDSIRHEPRVLDVANGMLQFTMQIGSADDIDRWPDALDLFQLESMRRGYDAGTFEPLEPQEIAMLPWLMIEALVVESIAPIAVRGQFGSIPGDRFLRHIERQIGWIRPRIDDLVSKLR